MLRNLLPTLSLCALSSACARQVPPQAPLTGATAQGIVLGEDGAPIEGAWITVARAGGPVGFEIAGGARTGPDGRFEITGLEAGSANLTASSAAHAPQAHCDLLLAEEAPLEAPTFVLAAGGVPLSGQITDADGAAVAGGALVTTPFTPQNGPSPCGVIEARTDDDGRYTVHTTPDLHALFGRAPGYVEQIDVAPLSEPLNLDYRLDPAAEQTPAPEAVVEWVRAAKLPLSGVEPSIGFDDLAAVGALIGDARVVALGESTHGTREFFLLKHRMLEYLVSERGFTAFALEAAMPEAFALNRYVLTGEGDPRRALAGLYFWTWDTEEVLALVEWMRAWNLEHDEKIRFYGIDVQFAGHAFERVSAYLTTRGLSPDLEALAPLARARTAKDIGPDALPAAAALIELLDAERERLIAKGGEDEWDEIRQCARVVHQHIAFSSRQLSRDAAMAENVLWILEREEKVVVWGHNSHVSLDPGAGMMGAALKEALGEGLYTFGLEFGAGSFRAIPFPFWRKLGVQELSVPALEDESLPAMLSRASDAPFALDLRAIPSDGEVQRWFSAQRPAHAIGAGFPSGDPGYGPMAQLAKRQYDALLFVPESTPTRPTATGAPPPREVHADGPQTFDDAPLGAPPPGWTWLNSEAGFGYGASVVDCGGGRCAELRRDDGPSYGQHLARLTRRVPLSPDAIGAVLRTEARVLSDGEAELGVTIEGDESQSFGALARGSSGLLTSPGWQDVTIDVEIPEGAGFVVFELSFEGEGAVLLDELGAAPLEGPAAE